MITVGWCDLHALVREWLQSLLKYRYINQKVTDVIGKKISSQFVPPQKNLLRRLEDGPTHITSSFYLFICKISSLSSSYKSFFLLWFRGGKKMTKVRSWILKANEKQLLTEPNLVN